MSAGEWSKGDKFLDGSCAARSYFDGAQHDQAWGPLLRRAGVV